MQSRRTTLLKKIKFLVRTFTDKELTLFAASLSFYTIFTIIPLLLIFLTLLTSLPDFAENYESIKGFIFSNLLPVNSEVIVGHIDDFLENATKIGVIGLLMILATSLLFFNNFEYIANKIFRAEQRELLGRMLLYLAVLILSPIMLGASFYISAYVATLIASNRVTEGVNILPFVPYLLNWGFFFVLFQMMPNVRVHPKASLISSFSISIVFSISKNAFIYYVFLNKAYTTMYGSFAIIIFLFLWIYISWIIFIYGLKLCHIIDGIYKNRESVSH